MEDVLAWHFAGVGHLDGSGGDDEFGREDLVCLLLDLGSAATENACSDASLELQKVVGRANDGICIFKS